MKKSSKKGFFWIMCITPFILGVSCRKVTAEDTDLYLRGKVSLRDMISKEEIESNKSDIVVKLYKNGQDKDFIYSVNPKTEDYFAFNVPFDRNYPDYFVKASLKAGSDEFESPFVKFTRSEDSGYTQKPLILEQDTSVANDFAIKATDESYAPLNNCKLFFYINKTIATSGFSINTAFTYTTDNNGVFKLRKFPEGTYYVNAIAEYNTTLTYKRDLHTVVIKNHGLINDTIILKQE